MADPGQERSRPGARSGSQKIAAGDALSVTPTADFTSRDVLVAEILALDPDALYAASLGWRLGRLDAEERAKQMIAEAGRDVACSPDWRAIRRWPTHAELRRRRSA